MKRVFLIIIPLIILTGIVLWYALKPTPTPYLPPNPTPILTLSPTISVIPSTPSGLIYDNSKYGFTLNLPNTWQGYKVTTYEVQNPNDRSICFSFPNDPDNGQPICVLQLNVFTNQEWANIVKKPDVMGQNNQYVFVDEYSPDCVQHDPFQCLRAKEVPSIIQTFKFK